MEKDVMQRPKEKDPGSAGVFFWQTQLIGKWLGRCDAGTEWYSSN